MSCSLRSASRGRSRSRSYMSRSHSRSNENYMAVASHASSQSTGRAASVDNPTRARWLDEVARAKPKCNKSGTPKGFGSFCDRKHGDYSRTELEAEQGHLDRVRTADLLPEHRAERELMDDYSHKSSGWADCTSINPALYRAQQEVEQVFKEECEVNKRAKLSY